MNIKAKLRTAVIQSRKIAGCAYRNPKRFQKNVAELSVPALSTALAQAALPVLVPSLATPYYFREVRKGVIWGSLITIGGAAVLTDIETRWDVEE